MTCVYVKCTICGNPINTDKDNYSEDIYGNCVCNNCILKGFRLEERK